MRCRTCGAENVQHARFCLQCGEHISAPCREGAEGIERRQVTVLFTDLSGYTSMSEKLDPEEVREIMQRVFEETARIAARYDGYIDKLMGDAAMILFGFPRSHEDDPVRAIRAAIGIRTHVASLSPSLEPRIGKPIAMHAGIQTGLVVAGELNVEKGTERVLGDTVNVASRLTSLAKAGEIVVGQETWRRAEGFFEFEALEPVAVKGKAQPVCSYRVLALKQMPSTLHRLSGLKAELTGRSVELERLEQAVTALSRGRFGVICISGDAGSGKTRLLTELRRFEGSPRIQWREGQCHEYTANASFSLLVDLLARSWGIGRLDPPEVIREKITAALRGRLGVDGKHAPYVGSLFGLEVPELEGIGGELWKERVHAAAREILERLARLGPAVICLEDLHWADASSLDLLRLLLRDGTVAALFLCTWRPGFLLLEPAERAMLGGRYQEVVLRDLSPSESHRMVESLLQTQEVPPALRELLREKIEGNPFYIEETVNGLIEKGILVRSHGRWELAASLGSAEAPLSVQATLSARIDRLDSDERRLVQEAATIGKDFSKALLGAVSSVGNDRIDACLDNLVSRDLLREQEAPGDPWYTFKHALVRDAAYASLGRKTRQEIHGKIAAGLERLYEKQLSQQYETLAFHWSSAGETDAAVRYLVKSAEKSFDRYAVEEAHEYYRQVYELLSRKKEKSRCDEEQLIGVVNAWSLVFFLRGDFNGWMVLLMENEKLAEHTEDRGRKGLFHVMMGEVLWHKGYYRTAYGHSVQALALCRDATDPLPLASAMCWHSLISSDLLLLDEAIANAGVCRDYALSHRDNAMAYLGASNGSCYIHLRTGDLITMGEIAREMIAYGQGNSNKRVLFYGTWLLGTALCQSGSWTKAIDVFEDSRRVSPDPWLLVFPTMWIGICQLYNDEFGEGKRHIEEAHDAFLRAGADQLTLVCEMMLGTIAVTEGRIQEGIRSIERINAFWLENEGLALYALGEHLLGKIYLRMAEMRTPLPPLAVLGNLFFLIRTLPRAWRKAESHLQRVIGISEERKALNLLAQASLDLGILYRMRRRNADARRLIERSIELFEQGGATGFLDLARKTLATIPT